MVDVLFSGLWKERRGISTGRGGGHLTVTVPLSTQVYECVPVNLMQGVSL